MAKVETEITEAIVKRRVSSPEEQKLVMEDLKKVLEQEAGEEKPPALKKQDVLIVSDPKGALAAVYPQGVSGWAIQIEEENEPSSALAKIHSAAYDFNASPKGRKFPVETVGEALESVKAKFFKEHRVWVKTKEAVMIFATDNQIPRVPKLPD